MSRLPDSPVTRREIDLSWGGLAAANVAVIIALIAVFARGYSLGLWGK